ncbi:MAG: AAA family ATPase [Planctomycetota bacterium]|jgi:MoxR-like ATPase
MQLIQELRDRVTQELSKVFFGQKAMKDLCLAALMAEGHILIEGVPGTAKTLLAQGLASSLSLEFTRVQFTPDMMPSDVIGTNLFDFHSNTFVLRKGPVFTQILLADEINRTPPKTQAALLEAMQERQVTIDGKTYPLKEPFLVIATQNPIEHEGTYPLPEAQLDRFLFKALIDYPDVPDEIQIVEQYSGALNARDLRGAGVQPVAGAEEITRAHQAVRAVQIQPEVVKYIVELVRTTRTSPQVHTGASPRAAAMLAIAAKCAAALAGREYVNPDDVKKVALPCLRHRLVLSPSSEIEGIAPDRVLKDILSSVAVPR